MNAHGQRTGASLRFRMGLVMAAPSLIAIAVLAKVFFLQNVQGPELVARYEAQHTGVIEQKSRRGMIRDRAGRVLAGTVELESVAVRPKGVKDREQTVALLASALGKPRQQIQDKLFPPARPDGTARPAPTFVWLQRHADPAVSARVRELDLPGVSLEKEFKRFWPQGKLAGQLIGFADIDGVGRAGLESAWDRVLAGQKRSVPALRDGLRQAIFAAGLEEGDQLEGHSVTLTIDSVIQQITEEEMEAGRQAAGAKRGVALVMEVRTGDILAMALSPGFDPNDLIKQPERFVNWATYEDFEPGSVMKVFTLAAALDAGAVRLDTKIDCEGGNYRIGRHTIHDHAPEGVITAKEVVTVSSNIGIAKIAERLGKEKLHAALVRMGLHGKTGCDGFLSEAPGQLSRPERWPAVQMANIAFGQGVTVTPLQLAASMAGLANHGELMRPRLVRRIDEPGGKGGRDLPPISRGQMVSPETARQVTEAAESVVSDPRGTGSRARVPGFTVAGKTGTAQKVDLRTHTYADRWIGTFVGFVPADKPEIVVLVSMDEPTKVHYGGIVSAPVFSRIAARTLTHLGIYGDPTLLAASSAGRPAPSAPAAEGPLSGAGPASGAAPKVDPLAEGPLVEEDGASSTSVAEDWLHHVSVPEFAGMSILRALAAAEEQGLVIEADGSGKAVAQIPASGERVAPGSRVQVRFASELDRGIGL